MPDRSARVPFRPGAASGALGVDHLRDIGQQIFDHHVNRASVVDLRICQILQPTTTTLVPSLLLDGVDGAAVTARVATFPGDLGGNLYPHREMLVEQTSPHVAVNDAGGRSDHRRFEGAGHPDEHPELYLVECGHAVFACNLGAGTPVVMLDFGVGIEERASHSGGECLAQGRFADTHGPYEHDMYDGMTRLLFIHEEQP